MRLRNEIIEADCIDGIRRLDRGSIALVFADLPYGKTQNSWDKQVPMVGLWDALAYACRPGAPMVFTAVQPFTSLLVASRYRSFRYAMVWRKNKSSGALNANRMPLRIHEDLVIFWDGKSPQYKPVMTEGHAPSHAAKRGSSNGRNYGETVPGVTVYEGGKTTRFPVSVLDIPIVNNDDPEKIHPTQKPEDLVLWFLKTYTRPGDLVLDPTVGSGTTNVAAASMGLSAVGFETDSEMARKARVRLAARRKMLGQ
jgi:site-specific DNA-methyltransferase (adenine-specific)